MEIYTSDQWRLKKGELSRSGQFSVKKYLSTLSIESQNYNLSLRNYIRNTKPQKKKSKQFYSEISFETQHHETQNQNIYI